MLINNEKPHVPTLFSGLRGTPDQMQELKRHIVEIARILKGVDFWQTDNLMTFAKNLSFLDDKRLTDLVFNHANHEYDKAIIWRTHILTWAAQNALCVSGDFVECGTHLGYSVNVVADYIKLSSTSRLYWCYDLFEGNAYKELDLDGLEPIEFVRKKFEDKKFIRLVKGSVLETLKLQSPTQVAFLHLDLNSAPAEEAALRHFVPLMPKGAIVVLDDYGWSNYKPQKVVADNYFNTINIPIVELPTGQGLVIIQ